MRKKFFVENVVGRAVQLVVAACRARAWLHFGKAGQKVDPVELRFRALVVAKAIEVDGFVQRDIVVFLGYCIL